MPKFMGRLNTLVIPLFIWLVLLIPFAVYQRYYVNSQQSYLTEHGFRLLSAVGRQLDSYLGSINLTVKAAEKATEEKPATDFKKKLDLLPPMDATGRREVYLDYLRTFHPELPRQGQSLGTTTCPKSPDPKSSDPKNTQLSVEFGPEAVSYRECF